MLIQQTHAHGGPKWREAHKFTMFFTNTFKAIGGVTFLYSHGALMQRGMFLQCHGGREVVGHTFKMGPQKTTIAKFGLALHKGCRGEDLDMQIL